MPVTPHLPSEKILREMLDLLEHLTSVYAEVEEEAERDEDDGAMEESEVIDMIVEEAEDRGIDGETAERFLSAAVAAARKSAEG
jgi:hypothetical protein